jgi:hypothetical protein
VKAPPTIITSCLGRRPRSMVSGASGATNHNRGGGLIPAVALGFFRVQLHHVTCGSASSILPVRARKSRFFGISSAGSVLLVYVPTLVVAPPSMTYSHSHFRPFTSLFLCITTLSHCIARWKPQPSFSRIRPQPRYFLNRPAIIDVDLAADPTLTHTPRTPGLLSSLHPSQLLSHTRLRLDVCNSFRFPNQVSLSSILFSVP